MANEDKEVQQQWLNILKISVQSSKMLGKIPLKQSGDWLQVALIKKREHSLRTILLFFMSSA